MNIIKYKRISLRYNTGMEAEELTSETENQILDRQAILFPSEFCKVLSIRPATVSEIQRYNAENCAESFYSRYGTSGEF